MQLTKILSFFLKLVLILILIGAILEIGLRATGSFKTFSEKSGAGFHSYYGEVHDNWFLRWMPNDTFLLDYGVFKYGYITNSWGYRERAMRFGDSTEIRVLAFGDSFTEGIGADSTETYPRFLERMINDSIPDKKAMVLNFGHAGSDPFYYLKELEMGAFDLDPSHVMVGISFSDFDDYIARGGLERFQEDGTTAYREGPAFLGLYKKSFVARFVVHAIADYELESLVKRSVRDGLNMEATEAMAACLTEMNRLCEERGVKFLAFTFPVPGEACNLDYNEMRIHSFESFEHDFPFTEIAKEMSSLKDKEDCMLYGWPSDGHFNSKGYHEMAKAVASKIYSEYPDFW
ncbi:MAG: SGNH/GDSL hydrolase family protein [Bacteroidetes bacterium]|nr:SGNH/GDSL hydrolase family protein [Bacteroidota bacterium]